MDKVELRGRLKRSDRFQSSQHEPNHRNVNECLGGFRQTLIVCLEPSPSAQPGKGSLDNPAPRQDRKATLPFWLPNDFQTDLSPTAESANPLLQNASGIGSISPHHTQAPEAP